MIKPKLDSEIKVELLIKLAFGISIDVLAKEYNLTKSKIVNLRKNNYMLYNEFFEHWKIDKEVAALGLGIKQERAVSILKKFYKSKIKIDKYGSIYYNDKRCDLNECMILADEILRKDNINCWLDKDFVVMNHY